MVGMGWGRWKGVVKASSIIESLTEKHLVSTNKLCFVYFVGNL